ncbi:hypothetical protein CSPAE12_07515 [Colletotrichum incanum]|nr:hypothetical protein CSPAE12_07515 [Colletotrichum incanum]
MGFQTTDYRTEDMAYCMLGIFCVNMPLPYGEGSRAFMRLQIAPVYLSSVRPRLRKRQNHTVDSWLGMLLKKGVRMDATLREEEVLKFILFLDEFVVSIALWYHRDSIYVREPSDTIIPSRTARYEQQTIYIAKDMDQRMLTSLQRTAAEALSFDPSLLPANISLTVTNIWPKKEWRPQRNKFALTGTRHFSCTIVYTVEFDGVQIGEVFLICQWHASALKPLRYALITSQNTADIVKRIQDHENGDGQGQLLEASNMMEQFIVEGFQVVKVWHDELCFSPFVKRSSETDESTNKLLFFKMASLEYLIHPMPLRLSVPRSIGDEEEPGHRLERAPQFGGDCGMLVVQQPSAADIKEAERENTD